MNPVLLTSTVMTAQASLDAHSGRPQKSSVVLFYLRRTVLDDTFQPTPFGRQLY